MWDASYPDWLLKDAVFWLKSNHHSMRFASAVMLFDKTYMLQRNCSHP